MSTDIAARAEKIERAKQLVREIEDEAQPQRWKLAALCYELVDLDKMKPGELARQLDVTVEYIRQLRRTHKCYGDEANRDLGPDATFRDYRIEATRGGKPSAPRTKKPDPIHTELPPQTLGRVMTVVNEVLVLLNDRQNLSQAQDALKRLLAEIQAETSEAAA